MSWRTEPYHIRDGEDPSSLTMTRNERAAKGENPDITGTARMGAEDAGRRSSQRLALEIPDVALNMFHGPNTQLNC